MTVCKHDEHYYLVWSNTYGDELIDGTAYVREPPSPSPSHQWILFELSRQIAAALEDSPYQVYIAPLEVRLPKSTEEDDDMADTVVQPDILIVSDSQKIDARGVAHRSHRSGSEHLPARRRALRQPDLSPAESTNVPHR